MYLCDGQLKVLLIESLGWDSSSIKLTFLSSLWHQKPAGLSKRDLAKGCAEFMQKSVLFNRRLTIASIWRHRSNKQEKKGSLLPSALPLRSNIYADSHANPDFFQSDVRARARVQAFRATCDSDLFHSRVSLMALVSFFSQSGLFLVRVGCTLQHRQICSITAVWPCTLKDFTFIKALEKSAHLHTQGHSVTAHSVHGDEEAASLQRLSSASIATIYALYKNLLFFSTVLQTGLI